MVQSTQERSVPKFISKDEYRKYQKKFVEAPTYKEKIDALPDWEHILPQLIDFGPDRGESNFAFKTAFSRTNRPITDWTKCTKCLQCWLLCPAGAKKRKEIFEEKDEVDLDYCQGCGVCEDVCPTGAVKMVSEVKHVVGEEEKEIPRWEVKEFGY